MIDDLLYITLFANAAAVVIYMILSHLDDKLEKDSKDAEE